MCDFTQAAGVLQPTLRHQPAPGSESVEKRKRSWMDFPPSSNNGESCRCSIPIWFGFPSVCKVHKVPYHHHHHHHLLLHTISLPHQATNISHTRKHDKAHQTDIQLPWLSFVLFTCSAEQNLSTNSKIYKIVCALRCQLGSGCATQHLEDHTLLQQPKSV